MCWFTLTPLTDDGTRSCLPLTSYRITLSARASTFGGIIPICFGVLRLMTNSNFVGCSTGKSAGLAPLRILSTYVAARRAKSIPSAHTP